MSDPLSLYEADRLMRTTAERMRDLADTIVERDGSVVAATIGPGALISYPLARDVARVCDVGRQAIARLRVATPTVTSEQLEREPGDE